MPPVSWGVLLALAAVKLLLHAAIGSRYGFFRDEFYYLACGQHPAWGYVDQPPLVPLIGRLAETIFGVATLTPGELRGFGAVAGAATMVFTGLLARELGGGRFAQGLATLTVLVMPVFLATGELFETVVFDQLMWAATVWLAVRTLRTGDARGWLGVGLVAGIGLETKYTMGMLGLGLAVALATTATGRRHLRTPWPWLGGALALLCLLPNLLWQHANGWASLEFIHNNNARNREDWTLAKFFLFQGLTVGLGVLPLLGLGLWRACSRGVADGPRAVGWICAVVMLILLGLRGKFYYAGPIYPALAAVGCVVAEEMTARWAARRRAAGGSTRWLRPALAAGLVCGALPELPVVLPLLPPSALAGSWEVKINHDFPEEFGWRELTAQVEGIFRGLPEAERAGTTVLTVNYGEAAAIQRFTGIPATEMLVVCPHNNYWVWGPGTREPQTVIVVGARHREWMEEIFGRVEQVATIDNPLRIANEERGKGIYLCREPKKTLRAAWPDLKGFE